MLVVLLILVSAVLLGHGVVTESTSEVAAAGVVAVVGALLAVAARMLGRTEIADEGPPLDRVPEDGGDSIAAAELGEPEEPHDDAPIDPPEAVAHVVFVAGRTTFHDRRCQSVAGKVTSSALRADLEVGGMTACRRCLSEPPIP